MRSRKIRRYCLAALALPIIAATPRPARAEPITIFTVVTVVTTAYELYQEFNDIFGLGPSQPDFAQAITDAKNQLLAAMNAQVQRDFYVGAEAAVERLSTLQYRLPGDPQNGDTWNTAIESARETLIQFEVMVQTNADVNTLYEMAPTYVTLLATHAGLTSMKAGVDPGYPSSWHDTNEHQAIGINTINQLVGSSRYMCDPGFNPGAGNYNDSYAYNGGAPTSYDSPSKSHFWPKLENGNIAVGTWTGRRTYWINSSCTGKVDSVTQYCNPVTGACVPIPLSPQGDGSGAHPFCPNWCCSPTKVWPTSAADTASGVETARGLGAYYYSTNDVVSLLRTTMSGILSIGGGRSGVDDGSFTLPSYGNQVDPTISESSCSNTGNVAYPMIDVAPTPTPQPYSTGYLVQGDEMNIFPNQQVRITNQTAYEKNVARTATFYIPGPGSYTLVLRYNTADDSNNAFTKVGLQDANGGATWKVVGNNIKFPPTNENWRLQRLDFDASSGFPYYFYARLQYQSGATTYLDAAWLETR